MQNNIIKEDEFIIFRYLPQHSLFVYEYKPTTQRMSPESFRAFVLEAKEFCKNLQPRYLIDNSLERLFIADPEMQEWTVGQLGYVWFKYGLSKYAQVKAKDFIAGLSGQQTMETGTITPGTFTANIFETLEAALAWLELDIDASELLL